MKFYTTEGLRIGPKRYFTPEGFLVCEDVPIGRTGMMLYGPGETPVETGPDGIARIDREADELFSPECLSSFNGKPVVNDHPPDGVSADNWRDLAMGYVMNPRRGKGAQDDLMIADLILTDPVIIADVMDGKREVSSGYDNGYVQFEPGRGRQIDIRGNHVALVESGRCGSRCSIGDRKTIDCSCKGEKPMAVMFKDFVAKVKEAWKSKDEKSLDAALLELGKAARSSDEAGEIHVHAGKYDDKTLDEKFDAIDEKHTTHDSAIADHENRISDLEKPDSTGDSKFSAAVKKAVDTALKGMGLDKKLIDKMKTKDTDCPECNGTGKVDGKECPKCGGTGTVDKSIDATKEEEEEERKRKEREAAGDKALDAEVEKEEPKAKGSKDSAPLEEVYQTTIAVAEILSPGVHVPTFDRAAKPRDTFQSICGLRRKSLQLASKDSTTADMITEARGGRVLSESELRSMPCDHVKTIFFAAGALKKAANNQDASGGGARTFASAGGAKTTIAEINKKNRERKWPGQN